MITKDRTFLAMAAAVAGLSKDPSSQVGCVITDGRSVSIGYNGFGPTVRDDPSVLAKEASFDPSGKLLPYSDGYTKYDLVIHAEANALLHCSVRPVGWTLYCTHVPCAACCTLITGSGIIRVVSAGKGTTCGNGLGILQLAGVEYCNPNPVNP